MWREEFLDADRRRDIKTWIERGQVQRETAKQTPSDERGRRVQVFKKLYKLVVGKVMIINLFYARARGGGVVFLNVQLDFSFIEHRGACTSFLRGVRNQ